MTDPVVDALTRADLPRCVEVERALFADESPWSMDAFVSELSAPHTTYVAVRPAAGAPIAGYAGISVLGPPGDQECEVHTVAVASEHRGAGYGRLLVDALLEVADAAGAPVFLEVRTGNAVAIALYKSVGFTVAGLRRNYYQPSGADAYTMVRDARSGTSEGRGD
ncbi:ribosomal protein S18-alanine N-acetyltransferase [Gordonia shandongensis]|uniref:ribosomal protein S18-alanine N-acetyltransferase n=1 Tax=Gordonia shandongensis TaxID=376351 RepID=UPI000A0004E5